MDGLTKSLDQFISVFSAGYDRLQPYALGLLATLILIDIALTGAFAALGKHNASSLLEKVLFLGGWYYLTSNFASLSFMFRDSLIAAGLIAGGRAGRDHDLLRDPSSIASLGFSLTKPILAVAENASLLDGGDMLFYLFCYGVLMLCFLLMALQVYLAVIEFYLRVTLSCILLPFGVFGPTRFIGEKPIGAVVSSGIKLMVLGFILAIGEPLLSNHIKFTSEDPGFAGLWGALLTCGGITLLTWMAPSLATGFLSGTPALSAGAAAQAAVMGGTLAAGGAAASVAATRLAAGAAGTMGKAGAHVLGAGAAGAKMGAAASSLSGSGAASAAGGLVGALKGMGGAIVGGVGAGARAAVSGKVAATREAFARGQEGFKQRGAKRKEAKPPARGPVGEWSAEAGGYKATTTLSDSHLGRQIRVGSPGFRPSMEGTALVASAPSADDDPTVVSPIPATGGASSPPGTPPSAAPVASSPPPRAAPTPVPQPAPIWADKTREHLSQLAKEQHPRPTA